MEYRLTIESSLKKEVLRGQFSFKMTVYRLTIESSLKKEVLRGQFSFKMTVLVQRSVNALYVSLYCHVQVQGHPSFG